MSKLSKFASVTRLKAAHHAPTVLTVVGIGFLVTSGVVAALRSDRVKPIVEDAEKRLRLVDEEASDDPGFTEAEQVGEKIQIYMDVTKGFLVTYGPAILLASLGTASVLYSHGLMKKRNAALVAAYGILERGYAKYRDRVKEVVGDEIEERIYRGHKVEVEDKNGKIHLMRGQEPLRDSHIPSTNAVSEYAVWLGKENRHWNFRPEYTLMFLRGQEKYANHILQARGYVMLNDIYDALSVPRTSAGAVVGWVHDGGDGYIDFGLPEQGSPEEIDYYHFYDEDTKFLLDFNVDGIVYDKIDQIK